MFTALVGSLFDALSNDGPHFDIEKKRQISAIAVYLVSHVSLFLCVKRSTS